MAPRTLPNLGLREGYNPGDDGWGLDGFNPNSLTLDALAQIVLASVQTWNTPPTTPINGGTYIVGASPSGAFSGQANRLAVWSTALSAWRFYTPRAGWIASTADGRVFHFNGTRWDAITGRIYPLTTFQLSIPTLAPVTTYSCGVVPNTNPPWLTSSVPNQRLYATFRTTTRCLTWGLDSVELIVRARRPIPNDTVTVELGRVNIMSPALLGLTPPNFAPTDPLSNFALPHDMIEVVTPSNLHGASGLFMNLVFEARPPFLDFYFDV